MQCKQRDNRVILSVSISPVGFGLISENYADRCAYTDGGNANSRVPNF